MKLQDRIANTPDTEGHKIGFFDAYDELEEKGWEYPMPIVHVCGRDEDGNHVHLEVEGFRHYFCVPLEEMDATAFEELDNDHRVVDISESEPAYTGGDMVKITVADPRDVRDLRETFERPFESDVHFIERFMVDTGIKFGFEAPKTSGRVHVDDLEPVEDADVTRRLCIIDIEVEQSDDGPAVVSEEGTEQAKNPITAITAYDSQTDRYVVLVLQHFVWSMFDVEGVVEAFDDRENVDVAVFGSERELLDAFFEWFDNHRADVLSGWNSQGFDVPYIVNRSLREGVTGVYSLSPTGGVREMHGEGRYYNYALEGVMCLDMLEAYKTTSIHELDSHALANVAEEHGISAKLDVEDIDDAWEKEPVTFARYNLRDVEVVVELNEEVGIV